MSDPTPDPLVDDGIGLVLERPDGTRVTFDAEGNRVELPPRAEAEGQD